jgi:hypothetical protein
VAAKKCEERKESKRATQKEERVGRGVAASSKTANRLDWRRREGGGKRRALEGGRGLEERGESEHRERRENE